MGPVMRIEGMILDARKGTNESGPWWRASIGFVGGTAEPALTGEQFTRFVELKGQAVVVELEMAYRPTSKGQYVNHLFAAERVVSVTTVKPQPGDATAAARDRATRA